MELINYCIAGNNYWQELNLVVEPKIANARILDLAVWYGIAMRIIICKYKILANFILVVVI